MVPRKGLLAALPLLFLAAHATADVTSDSLATDPIATHRATVVGDASRFTYNAASQTLTAQYDSTQPTDELVFPLVSPINQNNSFTFTTSFTINSITNVDVSGLQSPDNDVTTAQMAFGLINSQTTGTDRGGGNTFDIGEVDYWPYRTADYGGPSLGATVIESQSADPDFYSDIDFNFGPPSSPPDFLNTGVPITSTVSYNAATHIITGTFSASQLFQGSGLPNTFVYTDDLESGHPGTVPVFSFDSFALTLWDDSTFVGLGYDNPISANVSFQGFSVTSTPEPSSLIMVGWGALLLIRRRAGRFAAAM